MPEAISVVIDDDTDTTTVDPTTGTVETKLPDGGVVVQLDAAKPRQEGEEDEFYANLAKEIGQGKLGQIANDLYSAIEADDNSRQGHLANIAHGLDLLGLKVKPGSEDAFAPALEGQSSVKNPLLLENIIRGWANTVGELLPANGPWKIREDGEETAQQDDLAEALERDMNHYSTKVATEYYPDTSHMILWGPYFGGSGFKKVYRCPMRRRPVSESVDVKDLIVSDATKDLRSCGRITHQITMRPSVMKRMKLVGAYRDVALTQPTPTVNAVDAKVAGIQGVSATPERPEDQPYTIWECQCELDLPEFAPAKFKDEGIPLPYIVTMDKDSREILALRRDWEEDDEDAHRETMYVRYPYIPGPGFYGTGMLSLLGNSSRALTAVWREALDAGQFASFPGGLMSKLGSRQNTSDIRLAPGQFAPIETGGLPINQVVMGLPYKDASPGLLAIGEQITAQSEKLAGAADIPAAEGVQNVPVGTMLAQIEQATKVMAAAHKGMHTAQSEEFDLILRLFRKHPGDFLRAVRSNKNCPDGYWDEQKFLAALDDCALVPMSDPNVPSHIHRISKALAEIQLASMPLFTPYLDPKDVLANALRALKSNLVPRDPPPQAAQPDPKALTAHAQIIAAQAKETAANASLAKVQQESQLKAASLVSEQRIADTNLQKEYVIHQADQAHLDRQFGMERDRHALDVVKTLHGITQDQHQRRIDVGKQVLDAQQAQHGRQMDALRGMREGIQGQHDQRMDIAQHQHDAMQAQHDRGMDIAGHALDVHQALHPPKPASPAKKG